MRRKEKVRSERIELLDGCGSCGLLSVSDAMVQCAVVPAGWLLLILPCSLSWLMVHTGSEAEDRCGLNLVAICPVLFLPLCSRSPSFFLRHSLFLLLSIFSLPSCHRLSSLPSFSHLLLLRYPFVFPICWYHRKKECVYNLGENLMNT